MPSTLLAAPVKYTLSGKVIGGGGYSVVLLSKNGTTKGATLGNGGTFAFKKLSLSQIKGASLQLVNPDGQYAGPIVLSKKGTKVSTTLSGPPTSGASYSLGPINLKSGYAELRKAPKTGVAAKAKVPAVSGKPIGAGELGLVEATVANSNGIGATVVNTDPGADSDLDGIPTVFDADDDGDLILDGSDPDSRGLDVPYTALFFDFRRTLNAHVRSGLTEDTIDEAVSSENAFSLTFFYSLPSDSAIDGGHVVCDDSLVYCRKDTPLAYYGGISESNEEFRDHPWSELLNDDGFPRMERVTVGGSFNAIVASIQPRVGSAQFRPGDVYQVRLTSGERVISTRSLALSPYFVSIPAIKTYDAGFGPVNVDYASVSPDSGSIPGTSPGDPIVLDTNGLLTVTFWRPQRAAIRSDESGFYDWGNLNYGLILGDLQATCGGLYSAVSSELTADSTPLGDGDSPLASSGANLYPYTDTLGDRAADAANTITFTVNLKDCLSRAGGTPGTHLVNLTSAGEELTGGRTAASQNLYVQIP